MHTAPSGDLSVLHPLQPQRIWVGGKPMDDPEQRIAEAQVLLGLRTQPGPYLRNHEDIGIPEISFNEYLTINVKAHSVPGCDWEGQIGTILGHGERVQALHQARQWEVIKHGHRSLETFIEQEPVILREDICLWELHLGRQVSQGGTCEGRREAPGRPGIILCPLLGGDILLIDDRIGAKLQTRHDKRNGSGGEWLGKASIPISRLRSQDKRRRSHGIDGRRPCQHTGLDREGRHRWKGDDLGKCSLALLRYTTPNSVTLSITYGSPLLCFLPHALCHLCYDALAYEHGDRTPGREDTGWTLSRSWIRCLPCCASGAG